MKEVKFLLGMGITGLVITVAEYHSLLEKHPTDRRSDLLIAATSGGGAPLITYLFIGSLLWGIAYLVARIARFNKRPSWRSIVLWSTVKGVAYSLLMINGR